MTNILEIGAKVIVDGCDGIVKANSEKSNYGYCPEGCVIVKTQGGLSIKEIAYCS